jgi:hypothetical protein
MTAAMGEALVAVSDEAAVQLTQASKSLDKGDYDKAVTAALEARTSFEDSGDNKNLNKANLVWLQARSQQEGGWNDVKNTMDVALPVAEQVGDDVVTSQLLLLQAQAELATWEKAKASYPEDQRDGYAEQVQQVAYSSGSKALTLSRKSDDEVNQANALYLISQSYNLTQQSDDAVRYGKQAAGIFAGLKDHRMTAAAMLTVAESFRVKGQSENALRAIKEATSKALSSGDRLVMEGCMNFSAQLELALRARYTDDDGKEQYVPYTEQNHVIAHCLRYKPK